MRRLSPVGCLAVLIAILGPAQAAAQVDQGLSDQELIDPWIRAKAVVLSLPPLLESPAAKAQREPLDADIANIADELSNLQAELERVAIRIVTVPEFAYDAAHKSAELSAQVLDIEKSFDALFGQLKIRERPDVQAMQGAIDSLQRSLSKKDAFERDVVRAIASGSKNEMQALAGRWWKVGESVEGVKLAVESLRQQPARAPATEKKD